MQRVECNGLGADAVNIFSERTASLNLFYQPMSKHKKKTTSILNTGNTNPFVQMWFKTLNTIPKVQMYTIRTSLTIGTSVYHKRNSLP